MSTRHKAREVALQVLYRFEHAHPERATDNLTADSKLLDEISRHFDHFAVPEMVRGFAAELVAGTLSSQADLDARIEKHTKNWRLTRLSIIDRALLRMATYEMLKVTDVPRSVTLDEAIELAKQFGTAETPAFVNGILDAVSREITAESQA